VGRFVLKHFLKPLVNVLYVYIIIALGVASNIAQLTNFNLLNYLKKHSPQSFYFVIAGSLLLYLVFVIIEFARKEPTNQSSALDNKSSQIISTRDVNNSTFIQIRKDKGDKK
jgi:uncharacterized membrane protein